MTKFDKCIIHIGTEKTGTTSVQNCLANNRALLASQGIYYPQSLGNDNHIKLTIYACDDVKTNQDLLAIYNINTQQELALFRKQLKQDLSAELSNIKTDKKLLLVSNEHLHSRISNVDKIECLIKLLNPYSNNIEVIVYLRRQDQMAVSFYSTLLKSGGIRSSVLPCVQDSSYDYFIKNYFDFKHLLAQWTDVVGDKNIKIRLFNQTQLIENNVVIDYVHSIGLDKTLIEQLVFPEKENESLLPVAQDFLLAFNKKFPLFNDNSNPYRVGVIKFLEQHFSGQGKKPTKQAASEFYDLFKADNNFIAQRYFKCDSLFTENFDDYLDTESQCDNQAFLELVVAVWEDRQTQIIHLKQQMENTKIETLFLNARILKLEKQYSAAENRLLKIIELDPNHARAYKNLAEIMEINGDITKAFAFINQAIVLDNKEMFLKLRAKWLEKYHCQ